MFGLIDFIPHNTLDKYSYVTTDSFLHIINLHRIFRVKFQVLTLLIVQTSRMLCPAIHKVRTRLFKTDKITFHSWRK